MRDIYDEHTGLRDRFAGAGTVAPELAKWLGLVGLAGRASAQPLDLRLDAPVTPYAELGVQRCTREDGDVLARVTVRFDELAESLRLIRQLLRSLPADGHGVAVAVPPAGATAVGLIEGWRGPVVVGLEAGPDGTIRAATPRTRRGTTGPLSNTPSSATSFRTFRSSTSRSTFPTAGTISRALRC